MAESDQTLNVNFLSFPKDIFPLWYGKCLKPNTEEILANIFIAFSLMIFLAFFTIFDANITILVLGPYIAFQYNFSWNVGQEFKAINSSPCRFISIFDKLLFIWSELLIPEICDNFSKSFKIFSWGIKLFSHSRLVFFKRYSSLRALIWLHVTFSPELFKTILTNLNKICQHTYD